MLLQPKKKTKTKLSISLFCDKFHCILFCVTSATLQNQHSRFLFLFFAIIRIGKAGGAMYRIKTWEELTIQDNFLFQKVMQNKRICKHLIELILQIKIKDISFPETEKTLALGMTEKASAWMYTWKMKRDVCLT